MKKIIFLLNHLQYSDGVAKVLTDICNYLPPEKYDITVKAVYKKDEDYIKNFNPNIKVHSFLGFYVRGLDKILDKIPTRFLYRRMVRDKYDVEVAFQYGISTKVIAASENRDAVHVAWMHTYDDGLILKQYYEKMDRVICVSKCNAERLKNETNGSVKAEYCYNLVDDSKLKCNAEEKLEFAAVHRPILVSVGRHSAEKGYIRLLHILHQLKAAGKEFECWLIGNGPEHEKLTELVSELGLSDCIVLTGAQKNPHKYTAKADIFICSSFSEGYSTACTEAAVLGIPIITTDVSGGKEIIETAECGMLVGMSDEELKKGIEYALDHPDVLNQWKKIAKVTAEKFGLNDRKKRMIDKFEELCHLK